MNSIEHLPLHVLLRIVHHRRPGDEPGIISVIRLVDASTLLRHALERRLRSLGLNDLRFAMLLTLFALDPDPLPRAELAGHVPAPPSSLSAAVAALVRTRHITCSHDRRGARRIRLSLTARGRRLAARSVDEFIATAAAIGRKLSDAGRIAAACDALAAEGAMASTLALSRKKSSS